MPLFNGKEVKLLAHPSDIPSNTKVFQIRFTGEIFTDFEEYSSRLDFYRVPNFACKYTGKSGFSYESALEHEQETKQTIAAQLPSEYVRIILQQTQFSQLKLTELVNQVFEACVAEYNRQHNLAAPVVADQPSKASSKYPFKKTLIKTQIRISAKQETWKNAPWIVHAADATEHNIDTEMPTQLKTLIAESKKIKTAKTKKTGTKTLKTQKPKPVETAMASKSTTSKISKSLKYPCDDQLLLLHDKIAPHKLAEFDAFWAQLAKIGVNDSSSGGESSSNVASSKTHRVLACNASYTEFNNTYSTSTQSTLAYRQLNHVFNRVWHLWSFVQVYHEALQLTPFPLSYLLDSLCYDKRCILLDELHCSLLEVIRQHCVRCVEQRVERQKQAKLKQMRERQRKLKAKLKQEQQRKEKAEQQRVRSDKQEADATDDDDEEDEESEATEEDSEVTEEDSDDEEDDEEEEEDAMSIADIDVDVDTLQWAEMAVFGDDDQRISSFKLDLLRQYLQLRCSQVDKKQEQEQQGNDDDGDMDVEVDEKNEDEDEDAAMADEEEASQVKTLLPDCDYSLQDEIWANLSQIRHFVTLGIEHKLDILRVLLTDALRSKIVADWTQHRVREYQRLKPQVKALDDKHGEVVKREKQKLRQIRAQLIEKKKSTKTSKSGAASSSSSSSASSASSTPNKENNGSRGNSESVTGSDCTTLSTTHAKDEIDALKQQEKQVQSAMNDTLRQSELQLRYAKHGLYWQCCTHVTELGADRFHNKYFWTFYTDGRVFVYHANARFHRDFNSRRMISETTHNQVKCCNEWEQIPMPDEFCWSAIATTTQFYQLLAQLDERGSREHELLRTLQALKSDIVQCMRLNGNDDYDEETVSTTSVSESTAAGATDEVSMDSKPSAGRRRSKRVLKKGAATNVSRARNAVEPYVQFAEKNYTSYKNFAKRK